MNLVQRVPLVAGAGVLMAAGLSAGTATAGPGASGATLTSCAESSLRSAIDAGGTVRFGLDCPDLPFVSTIVISGVTVM